MAVRKILGERDTVNLVQPSQGGEGGSVDGDFSRTGIVGGLSSVLGSAGFRFNLPSALTEFYMNLYYSSAGFSSSETTIISFRNAADEEVARIRGDSGTGNGDEYWFERLVGGVMTETTASRFVFEAGEDYWNIYIRATSSGQVRILVDGEAQYDFEGAMDGIGSISSMVFLGPSNGTNRATWSQVVVSDEANTQYRVVTLAPNGNASEQDWSGSYTDIDEESLDDSDGIATTSTSATSGFALTNLTEEQGDFLIKGFQVSARVQREDTGAPSQFQLGVRIGSTSYWGSTQTADIGFEPYIQLWENSPATGTTWTETEVNDAVALIRTV